MYLGILSSQLYLSELLFGRCELSCPLESAAKLLYEEVCMNGSWILTYGSQTLDGTGTAW